MRKPVLTVRTIGDPCLRTPSAEVSDVGPGERLLIEAMIATMYDEDGVGLAAPQVGINKRIIVIDVGKGPRALINPSIVETRGSSCMEEGCLSVPKGSVRIQRPDWIRVVFLNEDGAPATLEGSGLLSRAIQHECDHLDGKLIVDYADARETEALKALFPDLQF